MKIVALKPLVGTVDLRVVKAPPKEALPHYGTPEHRIWRAAVIKRADGRCQWPGCARKEPRMFADHIVELSDGGAPFDPTNGQCLCGQHHSFKTYLAKKARQAARG